MMAPPSPSPCSSGLTAGQLAAWNARRGHAMRKETEHTFEPLDCHHGR